MRIGTDRDDVRRRLDDRWRERMLVDAEGNELDPRRLAMRVQERTELRGLVLAVGKNHGGRRQSSRIQRAHALRTKLCKPLRKADRDVHRLEAEPCRRS